MRSHLVTWFKVVLKPSERRVGPPNVPQDRLSIQIRSGSEMFWVQQKEQITLQKTELVQNHRTDLSEARAATGSTFILLLQSLEVAASCWLETALRFLLQTEGLHLFNVLVSRFKVSPLVLGGSEMGNSSNCSLEVRCRCRAQSQSEAEWVGLWGTQVRSDLSDTLSLCAPPSSGHIQRDGEDAGV